MLLIPLFLGTVIISLPLTAKLSFGAVIKRSYSFTFKPLKEIFTFAAPFVGLNTLIMFVRIKSTPNSPRKSVQIVESVRDDDKVCQKIVRHIGIAMTEEELIIPLLRNIN